MSDDNLPQTNEEPTVPETTQEEPSTTGGWRQKLTHSSMTKSIKLGRLIGERLGLVVVILALIFTYLSASQKEREQQAFDKVYNGLFHHNPPSLKIKTIAIENQQYLKQAEREVVDDLLLLSEMSVALDVVSSSQIGISFIANFNVTLGHALNELNRGIKRALEVNLLSTAAIKIISIIARSAEHTHSLLITLCLWSWLLYFVLDIASEHLKIPSSVIRQVRVLSGRMLILFVTFYLILPYSIHFSAVVSQSLHAKIKADNRDKLNNLHGTLIVKDEKKASSKDLFEGKAKSSIHHLRKTEAKSIHQKVESLFSYLLISLTITLFDLIIMPVVILYGLYRVCRQVLVVDDKLITQGISQ